MERQGITRALVCIGLLTGVISISAAEKIKFSAPSQSSAVATEERKIPNSSPNLFDKFRNGGADALSMPMPQPQPHAPRRNDEKKDWIFGQPDEGSSAEDRFKRKGNDDRQPAATGLARYVEGVERQESQAKQLNLLNKQSGNEPKEFSERESDLRTGIQSAFANPNLNQSLDKLGRDNFSFSEYWKETTGMNPDRFAEQADLRRAEFHQIFEPRTTLKEVTTLDRTTPGQPAKAFAPAPTDFGSRTSQSSVSEAYQNGYMPMTGARTTVFDDVNSRALGRDTSSPLNTKMEQPKVLSQPAILPFPTRPGELFKRPGSY